MAILDYSGRLNAASFASPAQQVQKTVGMLQGLDQNRQRFAQEQKQAQQQDIAVQKQNAAMQEFKDNLVNGDANRIAELSLEYPEIAEDFRMAAGLAGEKEKQSRFDYVRSVLSGNADPTEALKSRIAELSAQGVDTKGLQSTLEKDDPQAIIDAVKLDYAMLDPKGSLAYGKAVGVKDEMTQYQQALVAGSKEDRVIRKLEADNKRASNEIKKESDTLKKEKLQAELDDKELKLTKGKDAVVQKAIIKSEAAQAVVDSGKSTLELIDEIENHAGFGGAIGMKDASHLYGLLDEPFSGTDESGVVALIETLEAQNFLTAIGEFKSAGGAGSLSDNEGKKLGAALSNLSRKQNEKDFKKSLNIIRNLVSKQVSRAKPQVNSKLKRKQEKAELSQNDQALEWATANPEDPRANAILKKLGKL